MSLPYRRILLKLSGEALMGDLAFGIDNAVVKRIADEIAQVVALGVEIGVVVGGGNIFRGVSLAAKGADRVTGDQMGMLATVMNALALEGAINNTGCNARVMSAVGMPTICETFTHRKALKHLENHRVLIFAGGTGNPFFTTDSGAALRAVEMQCDALLKATQVDGIYTADPNKDPDAVRFDRISHQEVLSRGLQVMDTAAVSLAKDNNIPVVVFSIHEPGGLVEVAQGRGTATIVS
ncbi:MAG: UMP kinase [Alphaproteobacteria bacterium]|uniref:UMP kinase n=1 Tax=Pararhizobium sp. IMCC21322 TaxID=3067903 RepID=UPI00274145CA|nr:UMP kinase [Pararhizobium sp. IMCC21322]MCR9235712.1 UMP kinase [Alphaproteobacteria bacterium]